MRDLADKYGSFSESAVRHVEGKKRNEGRTIVSAPYNLIRERS
jgi:hypothetical protein